MSSLPTSSASTTSELAPSALEETGGICERTGQCGGWDSIGRLGVWFTPLLRVPAYVKGSAQSRAFFPSALPEIKSVLKARGDRGRFPLAHRSDAPVKSRVKGLLLMANQLCGSGALGRYCMLLAASEKTLLALEPISRIVPTTSTRITASMTAYSAIS